MKRIALFLFLWITGLAALYAAEPETIEPGDIDALTNALKIADSTVYLKPGEYDLSALINAPMYAPGYYGASLLTVAKNTAVIGLGDSREDVVLKGPDHFRIFRTAGENVAIRNLTIKGGNAKTDESCTYQQKGGGAINIFHMGCVVSNCVMEGCVGGNNGGAVHGNGYRGVLYDCVIRECYGGNSAGIAYQVEMHGCIVSNNTEYGSMTRGLNGCRLYDCTFNDNIVYNELLNTCVAVDCVFERNKSISSNNNGAGVALNSVFTNCDFTANIGYAGVARGGTFRGCTFALNSGYDGGAINSAEFVDSCTVVSNTATYGGGLFYCANVISSTISFNYASSTGGGAYNSVLSNCTVEANVAGTSTSETGGGIYLGAAYDTVFSGNSPDNANAAELLCGCDISIAGLRNVSAVERCRLHDLSNNVACAGNVNYPQTYFKWTDYAFENCGRFRNCVFDRNSTIDRVGNYNTALFYVSADVQLGFENCTFVSNVWQYTFRGCNSSDRKVTMSNCVFYRNISNTSGSWSDLKGHDSGYVFLTNCVMGKNELSRADGVEWVDTSILGTGYEPGFKLKGDDPYAPKRLSMLRGAGTVADWMLEEGAVDFSGNPRIVDGKVDIGAYQYRFEPKGMYLLLK